MPRTNRPPTRLFYFVKEYAVRSNVDESQLIVARWRDELKPIDPSVSIYNFSQNQLFANEYTQYIKISVTCQTADEQRLNDIIDCVNTLERLKYTWTRFYWLYLGA